VLAAPAGAQTSVEAHLAARQDLGRRMAKLVERLPRQEASLGVIIASAEAQLRRASAGQLHRKPSSTVVAPRLAPGHFRSIVQASERRLNQLRPQVGEQLDRLRSEWRAEDWWLSTYGVLRVCPVPEYTVINNNFGVMVRLPHVPVHRHMGNDVTAPTGSPILAPFDGYASGSFSRLGGQEVRVQGTQGYVYNAHLSSFGSLGYVEAGDVIGYVGSTGDATGPHDHFEWHPWNGSARDPYPYLVLSCVDV
jgi:murein DD-endopeptidase MepM/ murein hydrolase activator NlpD